MKTTSLYRPAVLLLFCLVLPLINGCAAVDRKISLNYTRPEFQPVRHSGEVAVSRTSVTPPARNAGGDWILGSLNNTYGVHQADLLSDRSTNEWITEALLYELRQAGYTAVYVEALPLTVPRGLSITNMSVVLNENRGIVSSDTQHELKFNVEVILNGDRAKTFTVASRDDRTVAFSASREELERIMLQSLQDAMRKVIPDIITLIDKK